MEQGEKRCCRQLMVSWRFKAYPKIIVACCARHIRYMWPARGNLFGEDGAIFIESAVSISRLRRRYVTNHTSEHLTHHQRVSRERSVDLWVAGRHSSCGRRGWSDGCIRPAGGGVRLLPRTLVRSDVGSSQFDPCPSYYPHPTPTPTLHVGFEASVFPQQRRW